LRRPVVDVEGGSYEPVAPEAIRYGSHSSEDLDKVEFGVAPPSETSAVREDDQVAGDHGGTERHQAGHQESRVSRVLI